MRKGAAPKMVKMRRSPRIASGGFRGHSLSSVCSFVFCTPSLLSLLLEEEWRYKGRYCHRAIGEQFCVAFSLPHCAVRLAVCEAKDSLVPFALLPHKSFRQAFSCSIYCECPSVLPRAINAPKTPEIYVFCGFLRLYRFSAAFWVFCGFLLLTKNRKKAHKSTEKHNISVDITGEILFKNSER